MLKKQKKLVKLVQRMNPVTLDMASQEVGMLTGTMDIGCCSVVVLWGAAADKYMHSQKQRKGHNNSNNYKHVRGQRTGGAPLDWGTLFRDVPNDANDTRVVMSCLPSDYVRYIPTLYKALEEWELGKIQQCNIAVHYANALVLRNGTVQEISTSRNAMTKLEQDYTIRNKDAKTRFQ